MKKAFKTFVHETAKEFNTIVFSAGKIGYQVEDSLENLRKVIPLKSYRRLQLTKGEIVHLC